MRKNAPGTDNQQGSFTPSNDGANNPSETTRRPPTLKEIRAYFQGAIHDGTFNKHNKRTRIAQKNVEWLKILKRLLADIRISSWIYKEGKDRNMHVLETCAAFLNFRFNPRTLKTNKEKSAYVRGFFDAEGGIPQNIKSRFYIQLVQNNKTKLQHLKQILKSLGVETGIIHNPSKNVDPDYWRMFVLAGSLKEFIRKINSWHPRKQEILRERWMKI